MKVGVLEEGLFVRFVVYNRFQIEVEQTGVGIGILVIQKDEAILQIKRYRISVSIYGKETAAGLVVHYKIAFNEIQKK